MEEVKSIMFLKEKRNGEIKGHACGDGRIKQEKIKNDDADSLTVATESVFITRQWIHMKVGTCPYLTSWGHIFTNK